MHRGHANSDFLRNNRHIIGKVFCFMRMCFILTVSSLFAFLVMFYKTKTHMTELDYFSTVNKHMENEGMDGERRNRSWQILEQNLQ